MNRNTARNGNGSRRNVNWNTGGMPQEDWERDYNRNRYGSNTSQRDFTSERDFNSSDRDYDRFRRGGFDGSDMNDSEWRSSRHSYDYDRNYSFGRQDRGRSSGRDYDQNVGYGYGSDRQSGRDYSLGTGTSMRDRNDRSDWSQERYMGRADYTGMQGSEGPYGYMDEGRRGFNGGISGGYGNMNTTQDRGFFGKGPKGWKRSDEKIKDEVCEALNDSYMVDASDIDVTVKEGTVTLKGNVETREAKREAERCVEGLRGVSDVQNELRVKRNENISEIRKTGLS